MHMSDALLSPATGIFFWTGTLAAIAFSAKKLRENMDDKVVPLMGVLGAFIFAAQMINFTIPGTGSSGHLGGGMILAIILGPYPAFMAIASVLVMQSLFFADGGILALGCNIWNLGVYPCFVAYPLVYKPIVRKSGSARRIMAASILSVIVGLQLGALSVVLQTFLSGKTEIFFSTFVALMLPIHLAIGLIEGFITAGVVNYVRNIRPELIAVTSVSRNLAAGFSVKRVFFIFLSAALLTGGMLSWFASTNPDGLEWSIEKIYGAPELPEQEHGIALVLKKIQEKTALLPDYNFKEGENKPDSHESGKGESTWPNTEAGTSAAGILGSAMVLCLIFLIGFGIRLSGKNKKTEKTNGNGIR
jgi:cobalt/nickel transport system permease protein